MKKGGGERGYKRKGERKKRKNVVGRDCFMVM